MTLDQLTRGKTALISAVNCEDIALRKHILDMGLTPGTEVTYVKAAPMGDPIEVRLRGYELTLRKSEACKIEMEDIQGAGALRHEHADELIQRIHQDEIAHPGIGEKSDIKDLKEVIPEGGRIRFVLIGNQNCGKTTLFNQLTGSNQHVGNFAGVTVERKEGVIRSHPEAIITDTPGIYSLSPYTAEEVVTRDFLLESRPDCIINILDASNIERSLYLTTQLLSMEIPMVLALNMMDEVRKNGGFIDVNLIEALLGVPVILISAAKNEGIDELIEHAVKTARYGIVPRTKTQDEWQDPESDSIQYCIRKVMKVIAEKAKTAKVSVRFAATKLVEGDELIRKRLNINESELEKVERAVRHAEENGGKDRLSAISDMRFRFINMLCSRAIRYPRESVESLRSKKIDSILTGKYTGLPAFAVIMALIFFITFGPLGTWLSDMFAMGIDAVIGLIDRGLTAYGINPVVHSLVIDGVLAGVGSVLSFLPVIVLLFFFLSLLEDSGYIARVAFVMDRLLRKIGLSGRSIVPMLIGFGCSVPAFMAVRTLPSDRDRKMTMLLVPFMSCSAKLPVYAFFTAAFFPRYAPLVMVGLYFGGIALGILLALVMKMTSFRGEPVPFMMELPNYRMPTAKNILQLMWEKAKEFLVKAFTIILVASVAIWFFQTFDAKLNIVSDSSDSLLAMVSGLIAPIFAPLGLGDWRIATALISGFTAKEAMVSTLEVLLGGAGIASMFTAGSALVFLVFSLLYTPCVAAIAAVKRELGGKWAILMVVLQCVVAWAASFVVAMILWLVGWM